eukprot:1160623-Pelagomonas_calceolata.AAC.11
MNGDRYDPQQARMDRHFNIGNTQAPSSRAGAASIDSTTDTGEAQSADQGGTGESQSADQGGTGDAQSADQGGTCEARSADLDGTCEARKWHNQLAQVAE